MRGSEWYKWDLHVHTPASLYSEYGGNDNAIWDKFIAELESLPKEIKVLGINDYLFLDGYEKVLEYKKNGRLNNITLILPVIEFRVKEFVGSKELNRINYHIVFADEKILSTEVIKTHFLSALKAKANLNPDYSDEYTWAGVVSRQALIDFGKHIHDSTPDAKKTKNNFLEIGFNNINFELSKIQEILGEGSEPNTYLVNNYYKIIGKAEWEEFRWDAAPADKKTIINNAHFIFTASPSIESTLQGEISLKAQGVNSRLLHCSDAHQFCSNLGETQPKEIGHCHTWIKANPTFEGLRQVLYEPELRRKIQEENPNNKRLEKVIKSISFQNNHIFTPEKIYLNPDLNTIIGGKSSGKSLLLYYLASSIDRQYANKQLGKKDNSDHYKFSDSSDFDFTVEWEDGIEYKYKDSLTERNRQIVYIPQSYIIRLSENIDNNSRKKLGQFIRDILLQDNASGQHYDEFIYNVKQLDTKRSTAISNYFIYKEQIESLQKQKKDIGDEVGINNQITALEDRTKQLKSTSISDEQLKEYNLFNRQLGKIDNIQNTFQNDTENWSKTNSSIIESLTELASKIKLASDSSNSQIYSDFFLETNQIFRNLWKEFHLIKEKEKEQSASLLHRVEKLREKIQLKLIPYQSKLQHKTLIDSLETEIKKEREKLLKIKKIDNEIKKLNTIKSEQQTIFFESCKEAYHEYEKIIDKLNERASTISDIKLVGSVKFYHNRFRSNFFDSFSQRTTFPKNLTLLSEQESNSIMDITFSDYFEQIKNIFALIIQEQLVCKKYKTMKDGVNALLKDEFYDYWELKIGNDEMANMSPGKANLAILKLLIELSESNCPILIDQPEDNLDNRSIYSDLVQFIRKRKENRQLIIVTHNPNIVVGADSENIIVSNQSGQDAERENKQYRFEYINGSIENSFSVNNTQKGILYQMGIREHIAEILEGGKEAFKKREEKYRF